jgi:hypothetical protein
MTDHARQAELESKRLLVLLLKVVGVIVFVALLFINHFEIMDSFWIIPVFALAVTFAVRWAERIPENMPDDAGTIDQDQTYDLYFVLGEPRFRLNRSAHGVRLASDAIACTWEDVAYEGRLVDIAAIRLQLGGLVGEYYGSCTITFTGGNTLTILGCNSAGYPQYEQSILYRDFVLALHRRLVQRGASPIEFIAGAALVARQKVALGLIVTLMIPVLIVLPMAGGWVGGLVALVLGLLLYFALAPRIRKNTERLYDPNHIPSEMIV